MTVCVADSFQVISGASGFGESGSTLASCKLLAERLCLGSKPDPGHSLSSVTGVGGVRRPAMSSVDIEWSGILGEK